MLLILSGTPPRVWARQLKPLLLNNEMFAKLCSFANTMDESCHQVLTRNIEAEAEKTKYPPRNTPCSKCEATAVMYCEQPEFVVCNKHAAAIVYLRNRYKSFTSFSAHYVDHHQSWQINVEKTTFELEHLVAQLMWRAIFTAYLSVDSDLNHSIWINGLVSNIQQRLWVWNEADVLLQQAAYYRVKAQQEDELALHDYIKRFPVDESLYDCVAYFLPQFDKNHSGEQTWLPDQRRLADAHFNAYDRIQQAITSPPATWTSDEVATWKDILHDGYQIAANDPKWGLWMDKILAN